jgi:hypothetical protein
MSLEQHLIVTAAGTLTAFFLIVTLVSESRERQNIGNHGRSKSHLFVDPSVTSPGPLGHGFS